MENKVDILIVTYNDGKYIKNCIESILNQIHKQFRLVILDDGSNDNNPQIIRSFKDKRIEYYRNEKNSGNIPKMRNQILKHIKNEFVFFTDGDCQVDKNWIKEGLKTFNRDSSILSVEGILYYINKNYTRTLKDRYIENLHGNMWCTANMAFRKEVFKSHKFDEQFKRMEDRELAIRINRISKIPFNKKMIVNHQNKPDNIKSFLYLNTKHGVKYHLKLLKKHNDRTLLKGPIYRPLNLLLIFLPILALSKINKIKSFKDFLFFLLIWPRAIILRYYVWKYAIEEKVFVI